MKCPACGGPAKPWRVVPGSEPADRDTYELAKCEQCESAITLGTPPAAEAYATGIYAGPGPRFPRLVAAVQGLLLRFPLGLLLRSGLPAGAKVLDVGAGRGRLVAALRAAGYDAEGIDAAPRSEAVQAVAVEDHRASGLDAAVLWHVLEHMDDPCKTLERVDAWLKPGGRVLVGVPNASSLQAAIAGDSWFHLDVPRHRTHFSRDGLATLLDRQGFETVTEHHLVLEHNVHGLWFALLSRLGMTPGFPFHLLKRNIAVGPKDLLLLVLAGPLLVLPAALIELCAALAGRGGTLAVVAQRRS